MNIKKVTNSQLSTTESKNKTKNKLSKQPEEEQNYSYGDHLESFHLGEGRRRMGEKLQELKA